MKLFGTFDNEVVRQCQFFTLASLQLSTWLGSVRTNLLIYCHIVLAWWSELWLIFLMHIDPRIGVSYRPLSVWCETVTCSGYLVVSVLITCTCKWCYHLRRLLIIYFFCAFYIILFCVINCIRCELKIHIYIQRIATRYIAACATWCKLLYRVYLNVHV